MKKKIETILNLAIIVLALALAAMLAAGGNTLPAIGAGAIALLNIAALALRLKNAK